MGKEAVLGDKDGREKTPKQASGVTSQALTRWGWLIGVSCFTATHQISLPFCFHAQSKNSKFFSIYRGHNWMKHLGHVPRQRQWRTSGNGRKGPKMVCSNQYGRLGVFFGMASSAFLVGLLIIEMPTKFHVNFMHFFLLIKKWLLFFAHKIFATRPKLDMPTKCHAAKSKQLCSWLHL